MKMFTSFLQIGKKVVWLLKNDIFVLLACLFVWSEESMLIRSCDWVFCFVSIWFYICCFSLLLEVHQYWWQMAQLLSVDLDALQDLPCMCDPVQNWAPVDYWAITLQRTMAWTWAHMAVSLSPDFPSPPFTPPLAPSLLFLSFHLGNLLIFWKYKIRSCCCGSCSIITLFWHNLPLELLPPDRAVWVPHEVLKVPASEHTGHMLSELLAPEEILKATGITLGNWITCVCRTRQE